MGGARTAQSFHRLPLFWVQSKRNGVRLATSLFLPFGADLLVPSFAHSTLVNECNRLISTVTPSYPDGVENKSKLIFITSGRPLGTVTVLSLMLASGIP